MTEAGKRLIGAAKEAREMAVTYYTVEASVFAFDTEEQATAFHDRFADAFSQMPEAAEYAASFGVFFGNEEDLCSCKCGMTGPCMDPNCMSPLRQKPEEGK